MVSLAAIRQASRVEGTPRPNLKVIDKKSVRAGALRRFVYFSASLLVVVALFGVAFVQAKAVEGQRELDQLRQELDAARSVRAELVRDVDIASSPGAIVARAEGLGMVRAADPVYFTAIRPQETK